MKFGTQQICNFNTAMPKVPFMQYSPNISFLNCIVRLPNIAKFLTYKSKATIVFNIFYYLCKISFILLQRHFHLGKCLMINLTFSKNMKILLGCLCLLKQICIPFGYLHTTNNLFCPLWFCNGVYLVNLWKNVLFYKIVKNFVDYELWHKYLWNETLYKHFLLEKCKCISDETNQKLNFWLFYYLFT